MSIFKLETGVGFDILLLRSSMFPYSLSDPARRTNSSRRRSI